MQIQYCDGCNLRVDNKEIVSHGDKVFCPACAEKIARPGSSSHQPARPATGSGLRRTSPAPGSARRTPASGSQVPPSGMRMTRGVTTQVRSSPGSSTIARSPHGTAQDANKNLVWGLAGAGVLLAAVGVFLMTRGGKPAPVPDEPKTVAQARDPQPQNVLQNQNQNQSAGASTKTQAGAGTTTKTPPEAPAQPKSGLIGGGMEDFREGIAQRELDKIKQEKLPPSEAYRRYMKFLSSYRSTKAGKEAEMLVKSVEGAVARPADNAAGAVPGLLAQRYEVRKERFHVAREPVDWSKPLEKHTIANVDFPNRGAIGATFKTEEFVVLQITGFIEAPRDGTYTFFLSSDDGSLLYFGNHVLIENDGDHAMQEKSESIPLKAGKHAFKLLYSQGKGEAGVVLGWSGPDIPYQTIPASALSHTK